MNDQDEFVSRVDPLGANAFLLYGTEEAVYSSYDTFIQNLKIRLSDEGKKFIEPAGVQDLDKN